MLSLWLRTRMLWSLRSLALRVGRLFFDSRVSLNLKVLTALGALLIVSPIDLFGDIPVLGVVDDTALLVLLAMFFVRLCPPEVVAEYTGPAASRKLKNVTLS